MGTPSLPVPWSQVASTLWEELGMERRKVWCQLEGRKEVAAALRYA